MLFVVVSLQVLCLLALAYIALTNPLKELNSKLQRIDETIVALDSRFARSEQFIRDEVRSLNTGSKSDAQQLRDECSRSARELREELVGGLTILGDRLVQDVERFREDNVKASAALHDALTSRIDTFTKASVVDQTALRDALASQATDLRGTLQANSVVLQKDISEGLNKIQTQQTESCIQLRDTTTASLTQLGADLRHTSSKLTDEVKARLEEMTKQVSALSESTETRQEALRATVEQRLDKLNDSNSAKLEEMRQTVDEKLHTTLDKRLTESFGLVTDQLGRVQIGLGEMKDLATGVGDLKRVLTNVKVRGGFAEVQLGMLLEQVLSPEQFAANVRVNPSTQETVEYAIRIPNGESGELLLPIDAKFPREDWERLEDAQQRGDTDAVAAAGKGLESSIRAEARKISGKYINPPVTTPFALMFLPTEGLYAEVIRRPGLADELQSKYHICVAGPTTFGALLVSFQMGFRTFAIQKKGAEVWKILAAAKVEFSKFGTLMGKVESQVQRVQITLSNIGTRTRAINRKLKDVDTLQILPSSSLLETETDSNDEIASFDISAAADLTDAEKAPD